MIKASLFFLFFLKIFYLLVPFSSTIRNILPPIHTYKKNPTFLPAVSFSQKLILSPRPPGPFTNTPRNLALVKIPSPSPPLPPPPCSSFLKIAASLPPPCPFLLPSRRGNGGFYRVNNAHTSVVIKGGGGRIG